MNITQTTYAKGMLLSLLSVPLLMLGLSAQAAAPTWNTSGTYVIDFEYQGTDYAHDVTLVQALDGTLSGNGGHPVGANAYTWVLTGGTVSGAVIDFTANYTATADAVTPLTTMHVIGSVEADGTMSGTWSDNYQNGVRTGVWDSVAGAAVAIPQPLPGTLAAEDFGVVNYDTSLGLLKGYSAGFGLSDATFAGAQSVVVKLYNGTTLLQTNTATAQFGIDITGTQTSSPFDVSGTFNYVTDGYWTNVREAEYGQSVPATRVVATVTLANGKVVTAENTVMVGDATTIYPIVTPPVVTTPSHMNECKKGGWKSFANPTFKNQGQCVASTVR